MPLVTQIPIGSEAHFKGVVDLVDEGDRVARGRRTGRQVRRSSTSRPSERPGRRVPHQAHRDGGRAWRTRPSRSISAARSRTTRTLIKPASARALIFAVRARAVRLGVQEQGRAAACSTPSSTTCPPRLDVPDDQRCTGDKNGEPVGAASARRRAVLGAGVQDHDRPRSSARSPSSASTRACSPRATRCSTRHQGPPERIGRMLQMHANQREDIEEARAGDIVALAG